MFTSNGSSIECATCVAANTSACTECVVSYVLANDDGPIQLAPVELAPASATDRAIELFVRAGLVDDPVAFVTAAEFRAGGPATHLAQVGAP